MPKPWKLFMKMIVSDAKVQIIYSLIFFGGMFIFIFIAFRKNLYKFTGTRHKTRVIYGTALSIFLTSVLLFQFEINFPVIEKSLIVGLVISISKATKWLEEAGE
jgi:hypothetical protein